MDNLDGRVAVITGGASGIGRAMAEAMIAQGMQVLIADIEPGQLDRTAADIGAASMVVDVTSADQVSALAAAALDRFGTVDVLCNNAGIGPMAPLAGLTLNDWRWMIDVNLWGVIHGITAFLPVLRANPRGGHIVNTASMAGLMPVPGLVPYCASKYAVIGLSEAMAEDLAVEGSDIGVSILCPGPVRSNLGTSTRNRPAHLAGALTDVQLEDSVQFEDQPVNWLSAEDTAQLVIAAIRENRRYVITHPDMLEPVEARHRAIERSFQTDLQG
ncbi:SDR family NAD(P)-dependent oxidoreductase [Altererythrobacter xixiisoli]|uniref:SDR family NAD(P)-dependent oxidoreductase n=1 Tax=Croceibacterium xixiisoli TaxID=1476466 RepID=A0A6I4TQB1_9SPHN|nr:SDR family NAD(P)-dependent oxidoreductase [Croceibacterium xixiisoli]MXO98335.1 SDR family NAD(P)-dependent oxidoreductase [Croceibacterium xixiisoli]